MKKTYLSVAFLFGFLFFNSSLLSAANLDFGNFSSGFLVNKAWKACEAKDYKKVIVYVQKTLELYSDKARQMQLNLHGYAQGSKSDILQYWALNDVGTALVILGKAYRGLHQDAEALKTFQTILDTYSYAQCWDPHGWFWKPASVARDELELAALGIKVDFGNYDSNVLVQKAWAAAAHRDVKVVKVLVEKIEELYGEKAREMQHKLKYSTVPSLVYKQNVFDSWALNDVGTAWFILADTYRKLGRTKDAEAIYWKIIQDYKFAQCWKPLGGFWKPAEVAQKRLEEARNRQSILGF
ncbi:MAG: hypothetical protein HQL13_05680 [Candidatus Omnitrophica bacterium]|nr:hypothetical protein [Candidatus Omnitrophota bacterium]